jgi:hypothetical protein
VNFIDKQDSAHTEALILLRSFNDFQYVSFARSNGTQFDELNTSFLGDNPGQSRFTAAGRTPQYQAGRLFLLNDLPDYFASANQMILSDDAIKRTGAHSFGERSLFGQ